MVLILFGFYEYSYVALNERPNAVFFVLIYTIVCTGSRYCNHFCVCHWYNFKMVLL